MTKKITLPLLTICCLFLAAVSGIFFGCFSIFENHKSSLENSTNNKERKSRLDIHYFKELSAAYYTLLELKDSCLANHLLEATEDHMSRDGYDWQQIKEMEKQAELDQKDQKLKTDAGFHDGEQFKNPDVNYLKDPFYMYWFKKGKENQPILIPK